MGDLLLSVEREAVASASRHLAEKGLVIGTAGNISARQGDLIAVTPTGADLGDVTAEMVTVIDLVGNVVDGDLAPTSEVPLHTGIYAATNAVAITHAHAMASTALSCCYDELPALHYSCLGLGGAPRTAPYATFGSQELAENVIEALK
jgi:L-fuculose-phosphate aldolase